MQDYYNIDEISKELGISRQKLSPKAKKLGFDLKKMTEDEKNLLIDECVDVLEGKSNQSAILSFKSDLKSLKNPLISKIDGATTEEVLKNAKEQFDFVVQCLEECKANIKENGIAVKSSNGNTAQNTYVKSFNDFAKTYNTLLKSINDLEDKLKLTSKTTVRAIDD